MGTFDIKGGCTYIMGTFDIKGGCIILWVPLI